MFDIISLAIYDQTHAEIARQLFLASGWTLLGSGVTALLAVLTGWAGWRGSREPGTQARRTVNAHAIIMLTVTAVATCAAIPRNGLSVPAPAGPVVTGHRSVCCPR